MPLYKGVINITRKVEIPVFAESEEKAVEYLNSTSEWMEDEYIDCNSDEEIVGVSGAVLVDSIKECADMDFQSDTLCWHDNSIEEGMDVDVPQAFYHIVSEPSKTSEMNDAEVEIYYNEYFKKLSDTKAKFISEYDRIKGVGI